MFFSSHIETLDGETSKEIGQILKGSMSTSAAAAASPAADNNTYLALDSNSRPTARRRTVPFTKKKSNTAGGFKGLSGDTAVVYGEDRNNTTRGESVLKRSRDLLVTPTAVYQRRKGVSKPEKPKRQTVVSILSRTCLLLVGLLWLGQMIWRWSVINGNNTNPQLAALDYEGRISEVLVSFKRMTQMLQAQLEAVDEKIGSEVRTMTSKLKQVEEKGVLFEKELKELAARADSLDNVLGELKEMGIFSKEEFESFWDELKKSRSLGDNGEHITLDDIRAFAKEIVEKEIEKHATDGLGRVDYALASGGASVVRHSEPYGFGKARNWFSVSKGQSRVHDDAQKMLEPSFGEPGQCFALQGSNGFVEIKLRAGIILGAITLEHIAKSVAYDRSSAPKDCQVSAWFEGPDDDRSNRSEKILTEFSYDLEKSNTQTFNVEVVNLGVINMVRLNFSSNHGSSSLTCIYRFRVHGYEPNFQGLFVGNYHFLVGGPRNY